MDVRNSLLDAEEADSRTEVAGQALALAEESLRLVEAEYKEGKAAITRLLEAELAVTNARTRRSAASYDRTLSRIAIAHATGDYPRPPAPKETVAKEEKRP
jgi:outer membrane protein TolC